MAAKIKTRERERLSREAIVTGALALADREGLEAVTIRRLATDNSVTPMALYWHFKDKDAVLDGIADRIYASVEIPETSDAPWDARLRSVLDAVLAAIRPHPLVADLLATRVMKSESGLALAERVIGILREAGFSPPRAWQTASFLLCAIVILVTTEPGSRSSLDDDRDAVYRSKRAQLDSLDPKRFPNLLGSAEFILSCDDEAEYFAQGMQFLVSGTLGVAQA